MTQMINVSQTFDHENHDHREISISEVNSKEVSVSRVLSAVRMQYANAKSYFWVPAIIMVGALLVVILLALIIPPGSRGPIYSGGANAPIWYFLAAGIQALVLTFPFALALGITRWEFCASTLLAAAGAASLLGLVMTGLGLAERLTDGWGLQAYTLYLPWLWANGPVGAWFIFTATSILMFQLGFAFTVIYKRFGLIQLVIGMIILAILLLVPVWLITINHAWPQALQFLVDLKPATVAAGALTLSLVITGLGYMGLRRYEVR